MAELFLENGDADDDDAMACDDGFLDIDDPIAAKLFLDNDDGDDDDAMACDDGFLDIDDPMAAELFLDNDDGDDVMVCRVIRKKAPHPTPENVVLHCTSKCNTCIVFANFGRSK